MKAALLLSMLVQGDSNYRVADFESARKATYVVVAAGPYTLRAVAWSETASAMGAKAVAVPDR